MKTGVVWGAAAIGATVGATAGLAGVYALMHCDSAMKRHLGASMGTRLREQCIRHHDYVCKVTFNGGRGGGGVE